MNRPWGDRRDEREALRACELFAQLDDAGLEALAARAVPVIVEAGQELLRAGEVGDDLFVVVEGALRIERVVGASSSTVGRAGPGQIVGEIAALFGGARVATAVAEGRTAVLRIPASALTDLGPQRGAVVARLAQTARQRLFHNQVAAVLGRFIDDVEGPLVDEFTRCGRPLTLARGEALFHQGEPSDGFYIVARGRLEVVSTDARGVEHVVGYTGAGECVGEMALLTGEPRMATPYALRRSVLLKIGQADFEELALRHPRMLRSISRQLARRLGGQPAPRRRSTSTINVAVLPARPGPLGRELAAALAATFATMGATLHVDFERLVALGIVAREARAIPGHQAWLRFEAWLEEAEPHYAFLLLEPDATPSAWSERAIAEADHLVLAADSAADPEPSDLERSLLVGQERKAKVHLVLHHPPGTRLPHGTARWLSGRRLHRHHHVRRGSRADVERVARSLAGRALGLVLGGGGARGFAHVGVLRAMAELGLPIDLIGGTSIGGIMAAGHALGHEPDTILELSRPIITRRPFSRYTLPLVALLDDRVLDECLASWFGAIQIEDLWLPFFCNSSDLIVAEMVVHDRGSLRRAIRASSALPGILAPLRDGQRLLIDGGVINHLPVDVMRERTTGPVIAVDSSTRLASFRADAFVESPWELMWRKVRPGRAPVPAPSIIELLMRSTWLGNDSRLEAQQRLADLCLVPPVEQFGLLDFAKTRQIADLGYTHAKERLSAWQRP